MTNLLTRALVTGLLGLIAGSDALGAELQPPILLHTPGLPVGPTPGSVSPLGLVTGCPSLPPPINGIVPGQLVVRNGISPDVGPYSVQLPGYSTGLGPNNQQLYRPFVVQAEPGSSLRFDVVNQLDTGSLNENDTNLHTHGLIVPPRPCTQVGDYIFVSDQPGTTVSYRIDIPPTLPGNMFSSMSTPLTYPSGLYWFHGHLHEYTADEVAAGQTAFLYIGNLLGDLQGLANPPDTAARLASADTLYLGLRDIQLAVPSGATPDKAVPGQPAQWLAGADFHSTACLSYGIPSPIPSGGLSGPGYCGHHGASVRGTANARQDTVWLFTVNGQPDPTITMPSGHDGNWRVVNMSANATYVLELDDDATGQPQPMTALAYDGIVAGSNAPGSSDLRVGVPQARFLLTPGNRVELFVPNTGGPNGRRLTLRTLGLNTGASGDQWPRIDLAHVTMPPGPAAGPGLVNPLDITVPMAAPDLVPNPRSATDGLVPARCAILPAGQAVHRLITFEDGPSPGEYTLGSQVVNRFDAPVDPADTIASQPFNMASMLAPDVLPHICVKSGEQEVWEILNASGEMHNFHIHQTKFRLSRPGDSGAPYGLVNYQDPTGQFAPFMPELQTSPGAVVDIWRDTIALPPYGGRVFVTIPFYAPAQVGNFVYHCHILSHEEGGMMSVVQVYDPLATTRVTDSTIDDAIRASLCTAPGATGLPSSGDRLLQRLQFMVGGAT